MKPLIPLSGALLFLVISSGAFAEDSDPLVAFEPLSFEPKCEDIEKTGWVQTASKRLEDKSEKGSTIKVKVASDTYKNKGKVWAKQEAQENLKTAFSDGRSGAPSAQDIAASVCGEYKRCLGGGCISSGSNYEVTDATIKSWNSDNTVTGYVQMTILKGGCTCPP